MWLESQPVKIFLKFKKKKIDYIFAFYLREYTVGGTTTLGLFGITTDKDYSAFSQITVNLAPASSMPKLVEYSDISVGA
jgi:hypothetical protein